MLTPQELELLNSKSTTKSGVINASSVGAGDFLNKVRAERTPKEEPKSIGGFASNIIPSTVGVAEGIVQPVVHPIKTAEGLYNLIGGVIQKGGTTLASAVTGKDLNKSTPQTQALDSVIKYFGDRYGGKNPQEVLNNIGNTAYKDPAGFALDLSILLEGGGGLVTKTGQISKVSQLAKAGEVISKTGEVINPITSTLKVFGKGTELLTKGKTLGGKSYLPDAGVSAENLGIGKEILPISAQTKSPVSIGAEALASKGIGGSKIIEGIQNTYNKLNTTVDEFLVGKPTIQDMGSKLTKSVDEFKNNYFEQRKQLYKEASIPKSTIQPGVYNKKGNLTPAPFLADKLPETEKLLNSLIKSEKEGLVGLGKATSPELKTYEDMLKGLKTEKLSIREVLKTVDKLDEDIKYGTSIKTGNNAKLALIRQTLDTEITNRLKTLRPDMAEALDKADAFYQEGLNKINSAYSQAIISNADKPDIIFKEVLPKLKSVEDVKSLYGMIGEGNKEALQKTIMSNLFEKSKNPQGNFTPQGITTNINKLGGEDWLKTALTPEQYQFTKDIETISKAMSKGQKVTEGSQTAYLSRLSQGVGLTSGALGMLASGNIKGFIVAGSALMGEIAFNKFLASPMGKQLLTEGLTLTGETGLKIQKYAPYAGKAGQGEQIIKSINQE